MIVRPDKPLTPEVSVASIMDALVVLRCCKTLLDGLKGINIDRAKMALHQESQSLKDEIDQRRRMDEERREK